MRQKHSLGQVFLKDQNILAEIAQLSSIQDRVVVEVGSGPGNLTEYIVEGAKKVFAVELDKRFAQTLKKKFKQSGSLEVINSDILKTELKTFGNDLIIIGNIPYQISKSFIKFLVQNRDIIDKAFLTVQKEFAQKLIASPGKDYQYLSCYIQYYAKVSSLLDVSAKSFMPVPKVDSALVKIDFYKKPPIEADDEDFTFKLIQRAFQNKRKKISNCLPEIDQEHLKSLDIDPKLRPQDISLKDYLKIANALYRKHSF
jgi:16S rRNA (adenine1518-N6/adenine1519-N6)-dimethyltransferase